MNNQEKNQNPTNIEDLPVSDEPAEATKGGVLGGSGRDVIIGGVGNDWLIGGTGRD